MKNAGRSLFLVCLFLASLASYGQTHMLKGIIIDDLSQKPVQGVTIKVEHSKTGTFTDRNGRFSLPLKKLPVTLQLTAIGYEAMMLDITRYVSDTIRIPLKSQVYMLEGVAISASPVIPVFKDDHYSVMDYEIMDDNLLLLVYRYRLKRSQLVLLTRLGDTLDYTDAPETPSKLYKDALENVHYVTQSGRAYQCFFYVGAKKLIFTSITQYDTLCDVMKNFLFSMNNRLYFQEYSPNGFISGIGYWQSSKGKHYTRFIRDEEMIWRKKDDLRAVKAGFCPFPADNMFFYKKINAPLYKFGDNRMLLFNFPNDSIEILDAETNTISGIPITFHKEEELNFGNQLGHVFDNIGKSFISGKDKWGKNILMDVPAEKAYTYNMKNGIYHLKQINLYTGELDDCKSIPYIFPKKVQIYKGEVYFLYKGIGEKDKWKLLKMKVCN
ncbi:MAG TPA: carboxypeptidase-like regulatory domain-containing protein [Candidatus Omnitrophota bacterium]|nr:carboxypeptidase-like regulatory domain-containing protein [Candidatus Omnitrophota bacterium]